MKLKLSFDFLVFVRIRDKKDIFVGLYKGVYFSIKYIYFEKWFILNVMILFFIFIGLFKFFVILVYFVDLFLVVRIKIVLGLDGIYGYFLLFCRVRGIVIFVGCSSFILLEYKM